MTRNQLIELLKMELPLLLCKKLLQDFKPMQLWLGHCFILGKCFTWEAGMWDRTRPKPGVSYSWFLPMEINFMG